MNSRSPPRAELSPSTWVGSDDVVRWLEIALMQDLDKLLDAIIVEVPKTVGARDCSVYLLPQFVQQFNGKLTTGANELIPYTEVEKNFIVSARSTQENPKRTYGQAYYCAGEGLTGWVFEQRRPLLLRNMWDENERRQLVPPAYHSDKYGLGKELGRDHAQPFLAMPLTTAAAESLGVLKLTGTLDSAPFPPAVQDFLQPVVRALADLIQRTANLERTKGLKKLMASLAARSSLREVLDTAAKELPDLVDGSDAAVFLLDEKTGYYVLRATTSDVLKDKVDKAYYQPGEGLTGWVASQKRPLRVKNLTDPAELKAIDPKLKWLDKDQEYGRRPTRQYLAAPLLSTKESEPALGVIRFPVHRYNQSFTSDDEQLLVEFASSFVQILETVRVRELSAQISAIKDLFLASTLNRERLLEEATRSTDRVLGGDGCSLFLRDERSGLYELRATSAPSLAREIGRLAYAEGEGKTGRVIKERRSLRLNPVEEPEISVKDSVEADIQHGAKFLAAPLLADSGEPIGVIRLTRQRNKPDFVQVDENLLSSIASMLSLSLQTLAAHEANQEIVRALLSIAETNVRLVRDQHRLPLNDRREQSRWLALTTVTSHDGLRFNRAALFTCDPKQRTVSGICAVGPKTREDAHTLWNHAKQMSFDDLLELNIKESSKQGFHETITDQCLTLGSEEDPGTTLPWATCAEPAAVYRVQGGKAEIMTSAGFLPSPCSIPQCFLDLVDCDCFALIPFSGLDTLPSVLYVDNRFNQRAISIDQLRPLTVFADFFGTSMSLAEAQDRLLLRSERLATLGEFATSFSHQARQPLQIISNAVRLLEDESDVRESASLRQRLIELREGLGRLEVALRYLNGFARQDCLPEGELIDIGQTIRGATDFVAAQLRNHGISLSIDIAPDLPRIPVNPADLQDILLNLIANARDAMEDGGELSLRASMRSDWVVVEVSDTGRGIPEKDREAIFEPLFTTKPTEKGMGMGLALSRRLAERIGGSLKLASPSGQRSGESFVLSLPIKGQTR
ncbi:GAF domain-containing protein [Accumulibacter sp.]|uniref:GAF domain-containing protein n=1 Tax=Accumulibacter sp. TaxID=2053492 RepID=UPI00262EF43C|nr:GAF domain-containing protein [Accumulibacter sp.]